MESSGIKHFVYPKEKENLFALLDSWHRIVSSYNRDYYVQRLPKESCLRPNEDQVLLRHPTYTIQELQEVVSKHQTVPAGVTRFIVPGRLLNLRIPLDFLTSPMMNLAKWQQLCNGWSEKLRHYSENVYLCEV